MQLSKHLSLAEVIRSETAKRNGISNQPTPEHLENFKLLADNIFEKIRFHFRVPIFISSGYRSQELNSFIKGSPTSQHCKGQAIDIDMDGSANYITNAMVFEFIKQKLDFDQLIAEFPTNSNPAWVHVSYVKIGNKKQILVAKKIGGATKYIPYKSDEDLK